MDHGRPNVDNGCIVDIRYVRALSPRACFCERVCCVRHACERMWVCFLASQPVCVCV